MPRSPKIVRADSTLFPLTPEERQIYRGSGVQVLEKETLSLDIVIANPGAEALCVISSKVSAGMIDHLPNLKVISRFGSGTDNVDVEAASRRGILVTNVPEFCLSEVADHTIALLLASARHLLQLNQATRNGDWTARITERMTRLEGRQIGLVGLGRIAMDVAKRARSFGLRLAAYDPYADANAFAVAGAIPMAFDDLLASSDFISLHVPLTPATRHLMGREQFRRMKPGAILINTARGAVVDEAALVEALSTGHLGGAAVDVYEDLPVFGPKIQSPDHPLFHLPNVLLTPHAAACSEEAMRDLMRAGARHVVDVIEGRVPEHCVNAEAAAMGKAVREGVSGAE